MRLTFIIKAFFHTRLIMCVLFVLETLMGFTFSYKTATLYTICCRSSVFIIRVHANKRHFFRLSSFVILLVTFWRLILWFRAINKTCRATIKYDSILSLPLGFYLSLSLRVYLSLPLGFHLSVSLGFHLSLSLWTSDKDKLILRLPLGYLGLLLGVYLSLPFGFHLSLPLWTSNKDNSILTR